MAQYTPITINQIYKLLCFLEAKQITVILKRKYLGNVRGFLGMLSLYSVLYPPFHFFQSREVH